MRRLARYSAWGILMAPLLLVLTGLIITYMPPVADFLERTLWDYLSQLPIFSLALAILSSVTSVSNVSQQTFLLGYLQLLVYALRDAILIACCIFCLKSIYTKFNRKSEARFTRPVWLLTFSGVFLGVLVSTLSNDLSVLSQSIVFLVLCVGCIVFGMSLILKGVSIFGGGTYSNRRGAFAIGLLLGIVGDMFDALCGVFIATAVLQCHSLVAGGAKLITCLTWIAVSALALFAKSLIMDICKAH